MLELLNDPSFVSNIGDRGVRDVDGARRYLMDGAIASHEKHGYGLGTWPEVMFILQIFIQGCSHKVTNSVISHQLPVISYQLLIIIHQ